MSGRPVLIVCLAAGVLARALDAQMPPLCDAARKGDLAAARAAIEAGADLELAYQHQTPLMWAAKMDHPEVLGLLLEAGARVDAHDERSGFTALRYGAWGGNLEVVERLLAAGADPSLGEGSGYGTLAHLAAQREAPALIERLAVAQVPLDSSSELMGTPLHVAAFSGHAGNVAALLAHGARIDARGELGRTALHLAAQAGQRAIVRELLERGADRIATDELGRNPAHLACEEGHDGALSELRWDDAATAWSWALAAPDAHGLTPLHLAAAFDRPRCVDLLLDTGAAADARSESGATPLHWACASGSSSCAKLLLERGASREVEDGRGRKPFELLAEPRERGWTARVLPSPSPEMLAKLRALARAPPTLPSIDVRRTPGTAFEFRPGPVLAVWSDGLVVFALDHDEPGIDLEVGAVAPSAVESVLARCEELGALDRRWPSSGQMHGSRTRATFRRATGETATLEWDAEVDDGGRSARRSFVTTWLLVEELLDSLVPSASVALRELAPDGALRGVRTR